MLSTSCSDIVLVLDAFYMLMRFVLIIVTLCLETPKKKGKKNW